MTDHAIPPAEVAAHAAFVRRLAFHLLRDAPSADDAAQETMARALTHPPRPGPGVGGWFATVLRNVVRRSRRDAAHRERREQAIARPMAGASAEEGVAREEILRAVTAAVHALDASSRQVVLLRHYENLPPREIALRLGVSVEAVKSRLKRAHERLRASLDEDRGGNVEGWRSALAGLVALPHVAPPGAPTEGIAMGVVAKAGVGVAFVALAAGGAWWIRASQREERPTESTVVTARTSEPPVPPALASAPAAPPVEASAPSAETAPADAEEESLPVLDLFDGAPLPGIRVRTALRGEDDGRELTSSADGRIRTAADALRGREVRILTPGWRASFDRGDTVLQRRALVLYRVTRLHGQVRGEADDGRSLDLAAVRLRWHSVQDRDIGSDSAKSRPGTCLWYAQHGPRIDLEALRLSPDGTFGVEVPRIRRSAVVATAPGWASAPAEVVPPTDPASGAEVSVVLRPVPLLTGVLRDAEGRPVPAGTPVAVYVVRRWDALPDPIEFLRMEQGGAMVTGPNGRTFVRTTLGARTDDQGRFSVPLVVDGEATLFTHPDGFLPSWTPLGHVAADRDVVPTVTPNAERWVSFVRDGAPVTQALIFNDITEEELQVSLGTVQPDERGRANVPWLAPGRAYHVGIGPDWKAIRFRRWDGAEVIDLTAPGRYEDVHPPK